MGILAFFVYWAIQGHIPHWPLTVAWLLGSASLAVHYEFKYGSAIDVVRKRKAVK